MKKVLVKIGKIIGCFFACIFGFLAVLCLITLAWGGVQRTRGSVKNALPETPASFVPTVRLIAFTDTHNENDNVADAIDTAYRLFDDDPVYAGVDGFFGLGDFSSIGTEPDYANYADTLHEHVREETILINIHGNHEFKNVNEYHDLFIKYFGHEPNTVTQINGFSCIAFSGERGLTEWTFTPSSLKWLSDAIKEAEENAQGKAIFVFNHPHPWGTVYGSTVWGDPELNVVLNGHTAVVDFSGHSHFPLNDPRSINQASYTAVGCGAMARFELDNNGIVGQHPDGYEDAAQMVVIEADNDGSVRIRGYDLLSDTYFCEYYIDNVNDRSEFDYTYKNMRAHDAAPKFAEDAAATAYKNEAGEWVISFDEAKPAEGYIVHEYKVTIRDENGKKIFSKNFIDDYYVIDDDDTADFRIGTDTLESGKSYTLTVRAESAYHFYSDTVSLPFTAQ
ncbi:MAG: metallophosphoesterase [Clostridia bacterium]|nr:metallophosphoesterase [Clostridia bacterium]